MRRAAGGSCTSTSTSPCCPTSCPSCLGEHAHRAHPPSVLPWTARRLCQRHPQRGVGPSRVCPKLICGWGAVGALRRPRCGKLTHRPRHPKRGRHRPSAFNRTQRPPDLSHPGPARPIGPSGQPANAPSGHATYRTPRRTSWASRQRGAVAKYERSIRLLVGSSLAMPAARTPAIGRAGRAPIRPGLGPAEVPLR